MRLRHASFSEKFQQLEWSIRFDDAQRDCFGCIALDNKLTSEPHARFIAKNLEETQFLVFGCAECISSRKYLHAARSAVGGAAIVRHRGRWKGVRDIDDSRSGGHAPEFNPCGFKADLRHMRNRGAGAKPRQ